MSNGPAWMAASAGVAGAGAAWFAAVNGVRTFRQTRKDSADRSRPMVAAEFRDALPSRGDLYLVIKNYGPSVARDVQVTFDPPVPDPAPEKADQSIVPFLKTRYAQPISTLTPGAELRNVWYYGIAGPDGSFANSESTPDQVTVTIDYKSADGSRAYSDSYLLDVQILQQETTVTSSLAPEVQLRDGVAALQEISKAAVAMQRERSRVASSLPSQTVRRDL